MDDDLKFKSTIYYRNNKADYDMSATSRQINNCDVYAIQTGIEKKSQNSLNTILHYHNYDRKYYVEAKKTNIIVKQ